MLKFIETGKHQVKVLWKGEELELDVFSSSRLIFHHENFLIKIDHKPHDKKICRQTAREIEFWESLKEDKQYFAEILDYGRTPEGKFWLKQKKYYPDDNEFLTSENKQILEDLIFKYNLRDIWIDDIEGLGNWMVSKGEVIIYDWGLYA